MIFSTKPINNPIHEDEDDTISFLAAVPGTLAQDSEGNVYRLTEKALQSDFQTWKGGIIRVNHKVLESGSIADTWYDGGLMMKVQGLSQEARDVMKSAAYRGVSQESLPVEFGKTEYYRGHSIKNVDRVKGTGISLIVYPETPACPLDVGCGIPITSSEVPGMSTADSTFEYDVGKINNVGSKIKVREFHVWMDEVDANDPDKLKERIASEAAWGQMGVFYVYPRNTNLQVGDEIPDVEPLHVVNMLVSNDPLNPALNTVFTENQIEPQGGPNMGNSKEPTYEELKAKIAAYEAENADLKAQAAKVPEIIQTGIQAGIESHKIEEAKKAEHAAAVAELHSCMPNKLVFEEFMAKNPDTDSIRAVTKAMRSSNPVGAGTETPVPNTNALYSSGKEIYDKLGVTPEKLAKYNEVD
jgi:hypothetical protein